MWRVLVVDDEPAILQIVRMILERSGFAVVAAKDGPQALALLEDPHIDALLTDIVMPGMNGRELIREALERRPGLPVCCMTGFADAGDPELEQFPIIPKPFTPRTLIEKVRQAVDKRATEQADSLPSLYKKMQEARKQWLDAVAGLREITADVPSGVPHPDGALGVTKAGQNRTTAFENYRNAADRYDNALRRWQLRGGEQAQSD